MTAALLEIYVKLALITLPSSLGLLMKIQMFHRSRNSWRLSKQKSLHLHQSMIVKTKIGGVIDYLQVHHIVKVKDTQEIALALLMARQSARKMSETLNQLLKEKR